MKRFIKVIILLFFISCRLIAWAEPVYDSSNNLSRHSFPSSQMKEWRGERAFHYERKINTSVSLWDRIREKIYEFFARILSTSQGRWSFWTIVFIISAAIITYFTVRYNTKMKTMFSRKNERQIKFGETAEDIHSIDFPEQIVNALNDNNYRLAIRLQYLSLLKFLTDKELIDWRAGKTNDEYVHEIAGWNNGELYQSFRNASYSFDGVWYGEIKADKEDYEKYTGLVATVKEESKYVNNKNETVVA